MAHSLLGVFKTRKHARDSIVFEWHSSALLPLSVGLAVSLLQVLDVLLLRRTKVERAADVKLPPLTVRIRRDELSPEERDFYQSLFKQTAIQFVSSLTTLWHALRDLTHRTPCWHLLIADTFCSQ